MEQEMGLNDFIVEPVNPVEFRLRLQRAVPKGSIDGHLRFKDLDLNPLTYQAIVAGHPMDLTFMEYELLRFLIENPVRVWSRGTAAVKGLGIRLLRGCPNSRRSRQTAALQTR